MAGSSKASTVVIPSWIAISCLGAILVRMLTRTSTQPDSSNPDLGYTQGELLFVGATVSSQLTQLDPELIASAAVPVTHMSRLRVPTVHTM